MSSKNNALLNVLARLSIGLVFALALTGCSEKRPDDEDMTTSTLPPQPRELPDSVNMTISGSFTLAGPGSQGFISEYRAAIAQSIADVYGAPVQFVDVTVARMSMRRLMPSSLRRLDNVVKVEFSITLPEASAPELKEKIEQKALEVSENMIRTALASVLPREIQVASVVLPVLSTSSTTSDASSTTSDVMTTSKTTTKTGAQVYTTTTPDVRTTSTPKMSTTSLPTVETTTTLGPKSSTSASATPPIVASTTTTVTTTRTTTGSATSGEQMPRTSTTTPLEVGTTSTTVNLVSTEIVGSAEQGDMQIKTKSVAGFKVGMAIVIGPDTPLMEFNTIKAFGTIDLNSPLLFSHPEGTVVREKTSEDTTTSPNPCIATTTVTNPCVSVVRKFALGYKNEHPLVNVLGWSAAGFAGVALAGILGVAVMRCASHSRGEHIRYSSMPNEEALKM